MNTTNKGIDPQDNSMEGALNDRKESGKRGRKPGRKTTTDKADIKARLERSRQSARECRARKKLRYQYLEELVADREKAVLALRKELEKYRSWGHELDEGHTPEGIHNLLEEIGSIKQEKNWDALIRGLVELRDIKMNIHYSKNCLQWGEIRKDSGYGKFEV